jgi:hypothetical protein
MYFGGTLWNCIYSSSETATQVAAGLETMSNPTNPTDRNIDIKYSGMFWHKRNGSWKTFGAGETGLHSPDYAYEYVNEKSFRVHMPPWG